MEPCSHDESYPPIVHCPFTEAVRSGGPRTGPQYLCRGRQDRLFYLLAGPPDEAGELEEAGGETPLMFGHPAGEIDDPRHGAPVEGLQVLLMARTMQQV